MKLHLVYVANLSSACSTLFHQKMASSVTEKCQNRTCKQHFASLGKCASTVIVLTVSQGYGKHVHSSVL